MRKILGIVIFLLTLLPLIGSGDAFTIKAQNFAFENGEYWLPDVDVTAEHKVVCECCNQSFRDDDALDAHLRYTTVCWDYYNPKSNNSDDDDDNDNDNIINGYCYFCGQPEDQCTCTGAGCNGSYGGGNGGTINNDVGSYWYPDNNDVEITPPYNPTHQIIKGEHIFKEGLPDKSMKQETKMTCVPTAMANLLSHKGSSQSAEEIRRRIENTFKNLYSEYGDIRKNGISQNIINDFMGNFGFYNVNIDEVVSFINSGLPCLGIIATQSGMLHMMEIVGYFDNDNYFTDVPEAFQCIDPGTGEYRTIMIEEFNKYSEYIYSN